MNNNLSKTRNVNSRTDTLSSMAKIFSSIARNSVQSLEKNEESTIDDVKVSNQLQMVDSI